MQFRFRRPIVALVTAMLFSFSVAGHGFMMVDMSMKPVAAAAAAAAAATADMPSECPGCSGDDLGMGVACFAGCVSTVAILSDPVALPIVAIMRNAGTAAARLLPGRNGPPDPYPPRPIVIG